MTLRRIGTATAIVLCALGGAAEGQESVRFDGVDGYRLHARLHGGHDPGPAVLLLHQCDRRTARSGYEELAAELAARGFHVLVPDFRSYGESVDDRFPAGAWRRGTEYLSDDAEAALRHLVSRPRVRSDAVGVVGASCGGRAALALAGRHPGVRTVVMISTLIGPRARAALDRAADRPILCLVAADDPYGATTESMTTACAPSAGGVRRLIALPGDRHGTPLLEQDPTLVATIVDWLTRHLEP